MKKIDTVQIVRNIRDKQNKDIKDKSPQEIIEYYRNKAISINTGTTMSIRQQMAPVD